jgi:hypothetical protein
MRSLPAQTKIRPPQFGVPIVPLVNVEFGDVPAADWNPVTPLHHATSFGQRPQLGKLIRCEGGFHLDSSRSISTLYRQKTLGFIDTTKTHLRGTTGGFWTTKYPCSMSAPVESGGTLSARTRNLRSVSKNVTSYKFQVAGYELRVVPAGERRKRKTPPRDASGFQPPPTGARYLPYFSPLGLGCGLAAAHIQLKAEKAESDWKEGSD